MTPPTLVVVSGPPGTGKTTLAHLLAKAAGLPLVCRDDIYEELARGQVKAVAKPGDPLMQATLVGFFGAIERALGAGQSLIAEAAFQDRLWRPGLEQAAAGADIRVVRCTTPSGVAARRIVERAGKTPRLSAHTDPSLMRSIAQGAFSHDGWEPLALDVPTLVVDTTDGYRPGLDAIADFVGGAPAGTGTVTD